MAEIRPFRGLRYNQGIVGDLADVICPPYDVIDPPMQQALYRRSNYNIVRLEQGLESSQDTASNNKYSRAAATLQQWREQGILRTDVEPAIYLHDHYFNYGGKRRRRRGLIARVRLEGWGKKVIRPHENTGAEAKSDRLDLLRACRANLSPILALYQDPRQRVSSLLRMAEEAEPSINIANADGEAHMVWAITEPEFIGQLSACLSLQPLYIADGHHRYETALTYQGERNALSCPGAVKEAVDFVMMTLVELSAPGLVILPLHRLIRGLAASLIEELRGKLERFFEVSPLPLDALTPSSPWSGLLSEMKPEKPGQVVIGLLGLEENLFLVLRLHRQAALEDVMPGYHSEVYKKLDVSILCHLILEKLLGFSSEYMRKNIVYTPDEGEAWQQVCSGDYQLTFFLNPPTVDMVKTIADSEDRMPDKSTYFYPKLPAGLVINLLQETRA